MIVITKSVFFSFLAICMLYVPVSFAQDRLSLTGFASMVGGTAFNDEGGIMDYSSNLSIDTRSHYALQASYQITDSLSVTSQVVARATNDWALEAEWAYITYAVDSNWRIILGKQKVPLYMYSDYEDVSFAYHFINPPESVYGAPWDTIDGIGSVYMASVGQFDTTLHITYGSNNDEIAQLPEAESVSFKDNLTLTYSIERDWFYSRLSYSKTKATIDLPFINFFSQQWLTLPSNSYDISDALSISNDNFEFFGVGLKLEKGGVFSILEYTKTNLGQNFSPQYSAYYASVGMLINNLTIYTTYNKVNQKADQLSEILPYNGECKEGTIYNCLWQDTNLFLQATAVNEETISIGARLDVSGASALKFELSRKKEWSDFQSLKGNQAQIAYVMTF